MNNKIPLSNFLKVFFQFLIVITTFWLVLVTKKVGDNLGNHTMYSAKQTRLGYLVRRFKKVIEYHNINLDSIYPDRGTASDDNKIKINLDNLTDNLQEVYNDKDDQFLIIHAFAHVMSMDQNGRLPYTNLNAFIESSSTLPTKSEYNNFLKESICF